MVAATGSTLMSLPGIDEFVVDSIIEYRVGEDEYDIIVRYQQPFRGKVEDLESATVFYEGESIPLTAFARVEYATGLGAIRRIDGVEEILNELEVTR